MSDEWGATEGPPAMAGAAPSSVTDGTQGMVPTGDQTLDEIVRRLVTELRPERIYLFGSRARGDARPDSDYDLVVVVPPTDEPWYDRRGRAYAALAGIPESKDVVVMTHDEFEWLTPVVNTLPFIVLHEGRLVYRAT